jgi:hypothetical protein
MTDHRRYNVHPDHCSSCTTGTWDDLCERCAGEIAAENFAEGIETVFWDVAFVDAQSIAAHGRKTA